MKKKNLIILLLIPFIIALLGVVTINSTFNLVENDIIAIRWNYKDIEAFKVQDNTYALTAVGLNPKNSPVGEGNNLVWTIENKDKSDTEVHAELINNNNSFYLKALIPGEVLITCSNQKGNVFKKMTGIIYDKSVILVQPHIASSQNNIDDDIYYGLYDLDGKSKVRAKIDLDVLVIPESLKSQVEVKFTTSNLEIDLNEQKVYLKDTGDASFTVGCVSDEIAKPISYSFKIVEGVNCYTYDDLLNCTNRSNTGEVVVLRKSFESLDNYETLKDSTNVTLFGNYDDYSKEFSFKNEVYHFTTTYNKNYIDQWNKTVKDKNGTNYLSDQINVGLHVQKDFYGNGYTINMHNLTFPSKTMDVTSSDGTIVKVPYLGDKDLFRGPLPFYALGDPNNMPLIVAYGQDNVGLYVDGDNITVNDINLKNCDFGNMVSNLEYTGTVVEVNGKNNKVINSRLQNGKNVLRCFSSLNFTLENSMLSNSRNFLVEVGSNEYVKIKENDVKNFIDSDGNITTSLVKEFFKQEGVGDDILNKYLMTEYTDVAKMKEALLSMQNAFNDKNDVNIIKGSITIKDTLFYKSGIACIALESQFNGPFLYSNIPSSISKILAMLQTSDGTSLGEYKFTNLSGVSYPVSVDITGSTKFYDYKKTEELDITGLIKENISSFAASVDPDYSGIINIDKIFPIKKYLTTDAAKAGCLYTASTGSYINVPIAYYGGGLNLSTVTINNLEGKSNLGNELKLDLLDTYLNLPKRTDTVGMLQNMMLKSVTVVTGYEPFKFVCMKGNGYLYGKTPQVSELIENAKGGK